MCTHVYSHTQSINSDRAKITSLYSEDIGAIAVWTPTSGRKGSSGVGEILKTELSSFLPWKCNKLSEDV